MSWETIKLGDCCEITSSKRIFYSEYTDHGVPFYRSKEIIECSQGQSISEPLYITNQRYDEIKDKFGVPVAGDMLLTSVGTIGIPYIVKETDEFYFKDGNLTWFRNFTNKLCAQYLYYWVTSKEGTGVLNNTTIGSSQKALTISALKNIEITVPPIENQRRIADILSDYDDLIENNRKQIKLLEEAAQRLYKDWFVDLRFPGHEHTKIVDGVPEGWEKSAVAAVSSVLRRGISPRYNDNGKSVVINQKCIRQTVVTFDESRRQEKPYPEDLNLQDSDTVICSTGAGTLGRVGQIFGDYPNTTFDSHVTLVRTNEALGKQYLFQSLKAQQTYLMGMGKGSTNQLELSRETIRNLDIYVPSKKVLDQFEQMAQPIHDKISAISKNIMQLQTARDSLLPKLMSREVEV